MVEVYIGGLGEATGREKVLSAELKFFFQRLVRMGIASELMPISFID